MNTARLKQPRYFKTILISNLSQMMLLWERSSDFIFIGSGSLWIHSGISKIRYGLEKSIEKNLW